MESRAPTVVLILIVCCLFSTCTHNNVRYPPDTSKQVTITQGVWGNVWFWEGNFQPIEPDGTVTPIQRQVFIFEATSSDSVSNATGGFWSNIRTKLIATTSSNPTGFFQINLPVGRYSVFVKEDSLYWSGYINPIGIGGFQVVANTVTKVQVDINYKAGY